MALWPFALAGWTHAADAVVYQGKAGSGARASRSSSSRATRSIAPRKGCRCWRRSWPCGTGSSAPCVFPINPADGTIDPLTLTNMPGMAALDSADVCVMGLRFRELPDPQMKHFVDYLNAGKPIIALRTSTHAFKYDHDKASPYAKYDWHSTTWPGGFGQQVLGRDVGGPPRQPRRARARAG